MLGHLGGGGCGGGGYVGSCSSVRVIGRMWSVLVVGILRLRLLVGVERDGELQDQVEVGGSTVVGGGGGVKAVASWGRDGGVLICSCSDGTSSFCVYE